MKLMTIYLVELVFPMVSILLLAIGIGVAVALLGSVAFQLQPQISDLALSPLKEECQQIANEGYAIQARYPGSLDDLPENLREQLLNLDERWMSQCVGVLSADSIIDIASNVDQDFSFGE